MTSIWSQVQPGGDDAVLDALDAAARQRVLPWTPSAILPLPEVDWGLVVHPGELADNQAWPPVRFGAQRERLQTYHDLWRGDLSRLIDVRQMQMASTYAVNHFRQSTSLVASLLVREPPKAGGEGALNDAALMRLVHSAATSAMRSGVAHVLVTAIAGVLSLRVVDARYVYPTIDGGWIISEPQIRAGSTASTPDILSFTLVGPDGTVSVSARQGVPTGISDQFVVGPPTLAGSGQGAVFPILALPEAATGLMGVSWYEDLVAPVMMEAVLSSALVRAMVQNLDPLLLIRGNVGAYTALPGVAPSTAVQGPALSNVERNAAVVARLLRAGPLVLPDGIEAAEYVTWDANLEWVIGMLTWVRAHIRAMTGIPAAMDSETEVPSGMSLRRMFWQLDARTSTLYHGIFTTLEMLLTPLGLTLEWPNTFEVVQDTAMADEREDVDDEATARRGTRREA